MAVRRGVSAQKSVDILLDKVTFLLPLSSQRTEKVACMCRLLFSNISQTVRFRENANYKGFLNLC